MAICERKFFNYLMRFSRKIILGSVVLIGVGGGALATMKRSSSSAPKAQQLTSAEFNALQDQQLTSSLLAKVKLRAVPQEVDVILYRLLGCPYCARVKTVMDLCHIPYSEVIVDTLSGAGLEDPRYPLAPQLRLVPTTQPNVPAPFIVDSNEIIKKLAGLYGFERDLHNPEVEATRKFIADRYQGVTFAAVNSSWWYAFHSYPDFVPPKYQNIICRTVGATALYALASLKIIPKLKDTAQGASPSPPNETAGEWLLREAVPFTQKLAPFHGGQRPDLADVEMFAVVRNIAFHPDLKGIVESNNHPLGKWYNSMKPYAAGELKWVA